jgi:hypothetical protein
VKFRFEAPAVANQPAIPVPSAMGVPGQAPPGALPQNAQNPQFNLPGAPNPNAVPVQGVQPGQMPQPGVQPNPQNPRMPRPAETRRKRVLPAPGSQPAQMPVPGPGQPVQVPVPGSTQNPQN